MEDQYIREFRLAALISVVTIIIGAIFYHIVEHLNWLDAFYFCVVTLATVGYGDIVPHTPLGKIFTIFYILIGIGIVASFANILIKRTYSHRMKRLEKK